MKSNMAEKQRLEWRAKHCKERVVLLIDKSIETSELLHLLPQGSFGLVLLIQNGSFRDDHSGVGRNGSVGFHGSRYAL